MTLTELNLHLDLVTQFSEAKDSLRSMRESAMRAQSYDVMPHGAGISDKVGKLAIMIVMQEKDVSRMEQAVERSEAEIGNWIDGISDNRTRNIFRLRFLCGYEWKDVAEVIGGGDTADAVKSVCYRYLQAKKLQRADAP